jgi:hypothetical protein
MTARSTPSKKSGATTATASPSGSPRSTGARLSVEVAGLTYALDRSSPTARRSIVTVRATGSSGPAIVTDRVDLWSRRVQLSFARAVAEATGRDAGEITGAIALLLDTADRAAAEEERAPAPLGVTGRRRARAEKLLRAKDLLDRAALALEGVGYVGEERAKKIAFLVSVSRLLEKPLSLLLLAPSASGKSALQDAVSALLPSEAVVPVARLTAQSLYYMGEDALRHRVVLVDEYEGAGEAEHPLRVLQSKGELRQTLTVNGRAASVVARGPVAVMTGTTLTTIDLQNTSRCITLSLDDGPEQTRRVQAAQAAAWAGERAGRRVDVLLWQDAQRLLDPLEVVIPFATRLRFPARTATDRRLSAQVLGLVAALALLRQRQRGRDRKGRVVATADDYKVVFDLLKPVFQDSVDGLSPRAARAYRVLTGAAPARRSRAGSAAARSGGTT